IWVNHYPMRSWDKSFHGSWQLYGHVHGRLRREDEAQPHLLTRDVGVDACEYRPVSFEELRAYMAPRVEAFRRRKAGLSQGGGVSPGGGGRRGSPPPPPPRRAPPQPLAVLFLVPDPATADLPRRSPSAPLAKLHPGDYYPRRGIS